MIWIIIIFSIFGAATGGGLFYLWVYHSTKQEVIKSPRIPMFVCPAIPSHGAFPAKHAMKLSVPQDSKEDLIVDMCPFCYDEKMKKAEAIFKV